MGHPVHRSVYSIKGYANWSNESRYHSRYAEASHARVFVGSYAGPIWLSGLPKPSE